MSFIEIKNLSFSFGKGKKILSSINLTIEKNEKVGIVGANGAGKSTLLNHLNGIISYSENIKIEGKTVTKKNIGFIRKNVGMVFQNPDNQLFSSTIYEDVAFGPINMGFSHDKTDKKVKQTLKICGIEGFEDRSPLSMSCGEKKRAAIASVLVMDPSVLVLDEPAAGLDPRGKRELTDLLKTLDCTQIIVSHDLLLIEKLCDRIVVLLNGKIVADDTTENILKNESLLFDSGLK